MTWSVNFQGDRHSAAMLQQSACPLVTSLRCHCLCGTPGRVIFGSIDILVSPDSHIVFVFACKSGDCTGSFTCSGDLYYFLCLEVLSGTVLNLVSACLRWLFLPFDGKFSGTSGQFGNGSRLRIDLKGSRDRSGIVAFAFDGYSPPSDIFVIFEGQGEIGSLFQGLCTKFYCRHRCERPAGPNL